MPPAGSDASMKTNRILLIRYAVMAAGLVALVLLGGLFVLYNHQKNQEQDIKTYRYSLAQESESLRQTYYQLVSISNLLVKNPVVINSLDRHLNGENATEVASGMVERNLEAIAAVENVASVFLVSLDGICLYSSRKDRLGKNYAEIDYVRNALKSGSDLSANFYAMMAVASGRTSLYYAQAIKNGSLRIGVAVIELRPSFFHLHSFTTPYTNETPQLTDVRIGLSTDGNILLNTADSSLVSLKQRPNRLQPETIPSLDFPDYDEKELLSIGFFRLNNTAGTEYYVFLQPVISHSLSLVHVINRSWFHSNYHPASSDYSGYLFMLAGMLAVMLVLLWMVNRRHRQVLLAAETLKSEAERRMLDKEKYEAIINRNPQGFWRNDFATGVILEVNQSLCRLLGVDASEIIGHSPEEFLWTDSAARERTDFACEGKLRLRNGQAADVLINASCITAPGTDEKICFSFFADISERKQEQEQLFLFSQAVEQSTSAIVITDRQAKIVYVNPAFSELTGWNRHDAIGAEPAILSGGERDTVLSREIWRRISGGGTWKGFLHNRRQDGSSYWEGQIICPLHDSKGRISHYLAIKNDITQRLELERQFKAQLAKLELMIEHAAIGIVHLVEHKFAWVSKGAAEMFGYAAEEADQLPISSLFENEAAHQSVLTLADEAFSRDQIFHADQLMRRKDGSLFWCSLTGKMIDPGLPDQGAVWLTKDISRQKEEERQLQIAKEQAEEASRAKNDFLASISHELRTPMNAIIGMNQLVLESGLLNEEQQQQLMVGKNAADFLLGLIDDLLDFSRIETQQLQLTSVRFELKEAVSMAVQTVRYPAEDKGLRLEWQIAPDVPRFIEGDALRLRQILVNLLKNSIKFSEKGTISVQAEVKECKDGRVLLVFTVRDQGIGIPPDRLNEIFERFVSGVSRVREGIGLGLAICSQLCALMGGQIWAESEPNVGSAFTFTAWFTEVLEDYDDEPLQPMRILVVDDHAPNRFLAMKVLERHGHAVVEACDGQEALRIVLQEDFDAVLMDVQMPGMDGLTVTQIIRECERGEEVCSCKDTRRLPEEFTESLRRRLQGGHMLIVALTANTFNERCCMEAGVDGYLVKPFRLENAYRVIRCCLARRKMPLRLPRAEEQGCRCWKAQLRNVEEAAAMADKKKNSELVDRVADHLKTAYSLEEDQVGQMIQLSASSISDTLTQADDALAADDLSALSASGHKAKGALASIGLTEAAELARQIELNGKTGERADYAGLLFRLKEELKPLLALKDGD